MRIAVMGTVYIKSDIAFNEALKTLDSFKSSKHKVDIYLWETTCPDDYRAVLRSYCKGYFYNDKNVLARSWNRGIQFAFENDYDYCYVINLDISLAKGCIDKMIQFAEINEGMIYSPYCTNHNLEGVPDKTYLVKPEGHLDWNTYACFMVRKEFLQMNGFDENFIPCYAEDVDMGYRLQLLELKHWCIREAEFEHYMAITIKNGGEDILAEKEKNAERYFECKWGGRARQQKYKTPFNNGGDVNYWVK